MSQKSEFAQIIVLLDRIMGEDSMIEVVGIDNRRNWMTGKIGKPMLGSKTKSGESPPLQRLANHLNEIFPGKNITPKVLYYSSLLEFSKLIGIETPKNIDEIRKGANNQLKIREKVNIIRKNFKSIYKRHKIFHGYSELSFNETANRIKQAADGKITITRPFGLDSYALELMKSLQNHLQATFLFGNNFLEGKPEQEQAYLNEMKIAIKKRGATVQRIFIFSKSDCKNIKLTERINFDKDAGVEVRCLLYNEWSGEYHKDTAKEMSIWDDQVVFYGKDKKKEIHISEDKWDMDFYQRLFNVNWGNANSY